MEALRKRGNDKGGKRVVRVSGFGDEAGIMSYKEKEWLKNGRR